MNDDGGVSTKASGNPKHISFISIGSIVCGALAFLLCWTPFGITLPLSTIGVMLAIGGIMLSVVRDTGLGLPIAALVINSGTLAAALFLPPCGG
jgi:hypothetical protein